MNSRWSDVSGQLVACRRRSASKTSSSLRLSAHCSDYDYSDNRKNKSNHTNNSCANDYDCSDNASNANITGCWEVARANSRN